MNNANIRQMSAKSAVYVADYLKDHLGNIRMTVDASGGVVSADDYYPFGMQMEGRSFVTGGVDARYKYNGKELDSKTGLLNYGARLYDARIGRFLTVDRFAAKYTKVINNDYDTQELKLSKCFHEWQ
jgi:RHS repeat-associated protein